MKEFEDTLDKELQRVKDGASAFLSLGALYLGATLALNAVALPIIAAYNGLERVVGAQERQGTARLIDRGSWPMENGGSIGWGKFAYEDGRVATLADVCDIPSWKFLPNTQLRGAQVGKTYKITSLEGPLSYKLITLEK
ncbi:MAG: hypothetical protein AABW79_02185 [Nanoarchaeota archaeon]